MAPATTGFVIPTGSAGVTGVGTGVGVGVGVGVGGVGGVGDGVIVTGLPVTGSTSVTGPPLCNVYGPLAVLVMLLHPGQFCRFNDVAELLSLTLPLGAYSVNAKALVCTGVAMLPMLP